jgi:secondary thiamine-phosphate synthase enzyme
MIRKFSLSTHDRVQFINITNKVSQILDETKVDEGLCIVYIPHTTAAVTINEAADPSVVSDMIKELNKMVPFSDNYKHYEGNSAAHIKSSLVGASCHIPVSNGLLLLGTWQGIFFCEFDGPRTRSVQVTILKS